jgi:hypothetical protein
MDFGPELVHEMEMVHEMQDTWGLAELPVLALDRSLLAVALDGLTSADLAALCLATPARRRRQLGVRRSLKAHHAAGAAGAAGGAAFTVEYTTARKAARIERNPEFVRQSLLNVKGQIAALSAEHADLRARDAVMHAQLEAHRARPDADAVKVKCGVVKTPTRLRL